MLSIELDIIECASILSALSTLVIASSSLYQLKRNKRDAIYPMIYPESIAFHTNELVIRLRNYGTGPAIGVSISVYTEDNQRLVHETYKAGSLLKYLNIAPNEIQELQLPLTQPSPNVNIHVHYRTVLRERLHRVISCNELDGITNISGTD